MTGVGNKNNNGSSFVTARHGGDGKGHMSKAGPPKVINHSGGVNPRKGPGDKSGGGDPKAKAAKEGSPEEEKTETAAEEEEEDGKAGAGSKDGDKGGSALPDYVSKMADKLRTHHGLTHNHSVRIAAAITKKHAGGHASVDETTRSAAEAAHGEMTAAMSKARGKK